MQEKVLPPGSVAKPALEPVASTMSNGCKLGLEPTPGPEPMYAEEVGDGETRCVIGNWYSSN